MELLFILRFPVSVGRVHSLMIGAVMAKGEKGFKNSMIFVFFCPFYKIVCLRACVLLSMCFFSLQNTSMTPAHSKFYFWQGTQGFFKGVDRFYIFLNVCIFRAVAPV